ncbi:serine/threonine-protein kinase [Nonomuraea dietziae]|uniref:serine/threonine-protein kinase n=1 Tax=Nonomuraea dietziae TaxID=65515 RepID=UPI00342FFE6C
MRVPGYTETRELGHGGAGRVMLAVRDSDRLPVAVKHLSDPDLIERFRAEAVLIAGLDSPHIARLMEYVEDDEGAAIVMELVDGVTLRHLLAHEGATGPEAALLILRGALLGLAEAHAAGVVHRDFKPENVMVTAEGRSRLVDFGVAAHTGQEGPPEGTPSYMAPEQWRDTPAGPATDVYAATVVFYECLTGHRPFDGDDPAVLAFQHQHLPPPLEEVDEPLRPLVAHGMAKDPADRPASAGHFLAELEAAAAAYGDNWQERGRTDLAVLAVPYSALFPLSTPVAETSSTLALTMPGGRLAVTTAMTVAAVAAVIATFTVWRESPAEPVQAQRPAASRPAALPAPPSAPPSVPAATPSPGAAEPTLLVPVDEPERLAEPEPEPGVPERPRTVPTTRGSAAPEPRPSPTRSTEPEPEPAPEPESEPEPEPEPEPAPEREPARSEITEAADPGPQGPGRPQDPGPQDPGPEDPGPEAPGPGDQRPGDQGPGDPGVSEPGPGAPGPGDQGPVLPGVPRGPDPLISLEVSASVNLPALSGEGEGLVDAGLGITIGGDLLGGAFLPGVLLLGRGPTLVRPRRVRREP